MYADNMNIDMNNKPECDYSLYTFSKTKGGYSISEYLGFDESTITIPDNYKGEPVIRIEKSVFSDCISLKTVFLGQNISVIEKNAFSGCSNLESVLGCTNLTYISHNVFSHCIKLSYIDISDNLCFLGCSALSYTAITSFKLPQKIDYISRGLFNGCVNLSKIIIHDNVIAIGRKSFEGCEKLSKVIIPVNVKYIGSEAFLNCIGLKELIIYSSDSNFIGDNILMKTHIWQPDRRYNPRIQYSVLSNVTVYCRPGSNAQLYCRKQGVQCRKLEWSGVSTSNSFIKDPIGIFVIVNSYDKYKNDQIRAIRELEKDYNVIIEDTLESEFRIFFYNPQDITQDVINRLIIDPFSKTHQVFSGVSISTKESIL